MRWFEHCSDDLGIKIQGYHGNDGIFTSYGFENFISEKENIWAYVVLDSIIIIVEQNEQSGIYFWKSELWWLTKRLDSLICQQLRSGIWLLSMLHSWKIQNQYMTCEQLKQGKKGSFQWKYFWRYLSIEGWAYSLYTLI